MKKLILIVLINGVFYFNATAQHKVELTSINSIENTNQHIISPKKSFKLFKKHSTSFHDVTTNNMPSRIQSILASDFREPSETLISRVENEKTQKNN